MSKNIVVSGVYDIGICRHVLSFGIDRLSFDLRPENLNFVTLKELKIIFDIYGQKIKPYFLVNAQEYFNNKYILNNLTNFSESNAVIISSEGHEATELEDIDNIKFISDEEIRCHQYLDYERSKYFGYFINCLDINTLCQNSRFLKWSFKMKGLGKRILFPIQQIANDFTLLSKLPPVDEYVYELHSGLETDYRKINYQVLGHDLKNIISNF